MSIQLDKVQPKTKEQLKQLIIYAFKHNIYDLNFIDTSEITDMSWLFEYISCNFDISNWDVSNVKDMHALFCECYKFTGKGLEHWDVSNVTDIASMFYYCKNFDCNLSSWDVSNVIYMEYMFTGCEKFNCDLSDWDISNMTRWKNIFCGCDKITIPNWYKKLYIVKNKI